MEVKEEESHLAMDSVMNGQEISAPEQVEEGPKPTYKSFKKKYRKQRIKFDEAMILSNELCTQEQQALATLKRLAQMNNQTLDLLLDINDSPQIPADKRFDITAAHPNLRPIPPLITPSDISVAALAATTAEGKALYAEFQNLHKEKLATKAASSTASKSLAGLMDSNPHLTNANARAELGAEDGPGMPMRYMSSDQIDEYLYEIDNTPSIPPQAPLPHQEVALRNPHSVYNWLRQHKPQVFLQDGEGSEKSTGKPGALRGAGKRVPPPAPSKPDVLEFVEEDGVGYEALVVNGAKGKRKRGGASGFGEEEDGGYHPKAGRVEDGKGKKPRQPRKKKEKAPVEEGSGTPTAAAGSSARKRVKVKPSSNTLIEDAARGGSPTVS